MRFNGTFRLIQQPVLTGCSKDSKTASTFETSCHVFAVSDVKCEGHLGYNSSSAAEVTLVAWEYASNSLHGPASSKLERTIIYPCDRYRCRVGCPCIICFKKGPHCKKAGDKETCGDCVDCREDYQDHLIFHRALHLTCKFCSNLLEAIPNASLVIHKTKGYWPKFYSVSIDASLFRHFYRTIEPEYHQSSGFSCDKCGLNFQRKSNLKKHEISKHSGRVG